VWRELAGAQRMNASLSAVVGEAVSVADDVEINTREAPVVLARIGGFSRWGGWAAAAALALAWMAGSRVGPQRNDLFAPGGQTQTAGVLSAADALKAYLTKGRDEGLVLGEMPAKVMLDAVPVGLGEGGADVYYIRQIVERVRVEELFRTSNDESGALTPSTRIRFFEPGSIH
jgi:hypothetical protein